MPLGVYRNLTLGRNLEYRLVQDGLVLHLDAGNKTSYPGSGATWTDISVNSNNGTLTNGPTYDPANKGSIVFDGVDDYVISSSFNDDSNQALSVFCWFKPSELNGGQFDNIYFSWLVNKRDNGNDRQWQLICRSIVNTNDHRINLTMWDTSKTQTSLSVLGNTTLDNNTWYYGGFTTTGSNSTLYLNGSVENTGTLGGSGVRKTGSRDLIIAAPAWNLGPFGVGNLRLTGRISNVTIYNRALSQSEVEQNFTALRGRYGI
jgi:hypothetical protein